MDRCPRRSICQHAASSFRQSDARRCDGRQRARQRRTVPAVAAIAFLFLLIFGCRKTDAPGALLSGGRSAIRTGDLQRAASLAGQGYREWRNHPESPYCWQFRIFSAEVLLAQGNAKDAVPLLETRIPDRAELRELAARRPLLLGYARVLLGDYAAARPLFEQAFAEAVRGQFHSLLTEVELRRGVMFARMGDTAAADAAFEQARQLASSQHDTYLEASAIGNLGYNLVRTQRFDEAVPYLEQTRGLSEKIGARLLLAAAVANLGRCYYGLGDFDRAIEAQTRAESLAGSLGDQFRQQIYLGNLGDTYSLRGDMPRAVSSYRKALTISRRISEPYSTAEWLASLANLQLTQGDLKGAAASCEEALTLSRNAKAPAVETMALLTRAHIDAALGNSALAETRYREVLSQVSDLEDKENIWEAHRGLGRLYSSAARWHDADGEFQQALTAIERARTRLARDEWKLSFHSSSIRVYQEYVDFLMSRGEPERALEIAEFARARVLAQRLGVEQSLARPVPAARFRAVARAYKAVLVSFWLAPQRSFVWVVTPASVRAFPLPGEGEIRPLVESYQAAIESLRDPLATAHPAGTRLAQMLLAPVRQAAPDASRVILVPDGALHEFNLETLPVAEPKPHYWIEDVSVAITPSLAIIGPGTTKTASRTRSLLLIGNAAPPEKSMAPLPAVEKELAGIRARLNGWEQSVYTGAEARPAVYRDAHPGRFDVIHFSAHAAANPQDPLASAVLLSSDGAHYKLYAREIVGIPLAARLVTVSACRGAGSRVYSGEGLVGFAWAFLRAGAQNVIAGLWEVNDASTAGLMDALYAQLAAGRPPAEALRSAKLALLNSRTAWSKPYYWAPFETLSRSGTF